MSWTDAARGKVAWTWTGGHQQPLHTGSLFRGSQSAAPPSRHQGTRASIKRLALAERGAAKRGPKAAASTPATPARKAPAPPARKAPAPSSSAPQAKAGSPFRSPLAAAAAKNKKKKPAAGQPLPTGPKVVVPPKDLDRDPADAWGYIKLIKFLGESGAPVKLMGAVAKAKAKGVLNQGVLRCAVESQLIAKRADLAQQLLAEHGGTEWHEWLLAEPKKAAGMAKVAFRMEQLKLGQEIMQAAGLWVPPDVSKYAPPAAADPAGDEAPAVAEDHPSVTGPAGNPARLEAAALAYPAAIAAHLRYDQRAEAARLLEDMARGRVPIGIESANRLIRSFHKRRDLPAIFAVLDVIAASGAEPDNETYECVANAVVHDVTFVKGAVSMETLPEKQLPEAVFVGRSNVGKSSLINMVCNRKALAYTSKTPGKTQQFNYFTVTNGGSDGFYLVDMPGVGYAKVPDHVRIAWVRFFRRYLVERSQLRVIFHLIDSRHGPVGEDLKLMQLMKDMPDHARYVVILTKADKNNNMVKGSVVEQVFQALRDAELPRIPVVLTSSVSKLGRDGVWRYLRLAVLGGRYKGFRAAQNEQKA